MEFENINPNTDGQESVVDSQVGTDTGESGLHSSGSGDAGRAGDHAYNSAMKASRLQGRREAETSLRKQYDEGIAKAGIMNPSTGKPFANLSEFTAYGDQRREEKIREDAKAAGKSVEEYREELADSEFVRSERKKAEENDRLKKAEQSARDFAAKDAKDFQERYPDVDLAQLERDKSFLKFAKGRLYKEPLADIYEDFVEFSEESERTALARKESRDARSTGAGGSSKDVTLSAAEQRTLNEWNERNPDMKMTAKEFKGR